MKNTNKNKIWIKDGTKFKMVCIDDFEIYEKDGWKRGAPKRTKEQRQAQSKRMLNKRLSDETKIKISKKATGKIVINKDDVEKHISKDLLDDYISDGWKVGRSETNIRLSSEGQTGHTVTQETKDKISKALTGRKLTEEQLKKWSEVKIGHYVSEETRNKISKHRKEWLKNNPDCSFLSQETREKAIRVQREKFKSGELKVWNAGKNAKTEPRIKDIITKGNDTKRKNNTFSSSSVEEKYYKYLVDIYGEDDIIRQYTDERYPFNCDFYIKSQGKFIEINGSWTHGEHPFNPNSEEDIQLLNLWESKDSQYYKNAINVWTVRDVKKQQTALDNNLNYDAIYHDRLVEEGFSR